MEKNNEPLIVVPLSKINGFVELRDYFAAHCPITLTEFAKGYTKINEDSTTESLAAFAIFRFRYADSMLKVSQS